MPANSNEWLEGIMTKLFDPEDTRIDKMIQSLTERNSDIKKKSSLGFMYMGKVYVPEACKAMYRAVKGSSAQRHILPLAFELNKEISIFQKDISKLELDKAQVKQTLYKLIYQATDRQEIRDALPECVVRLLPGIRDIPRKMEHPYYLIKSDWRSVQEYERMLPKIEFYAMTHFIY